MDALEEATAAKVTEPDRTGTLQGYAWAAWWKDLDYKEAGGIWEYVLYDPDGEAVKRHTHLYGRHGSWTKWHGFHPVTDYALETHVETEILCRVLYRADYTPLPEKIMRWEKAGDVDDVLRRFRRKERRAKDRERAARFYGCAPEQVSGVDLKMWRRRGQDAARRSHAV